ncbi:MAG: hypothetical protein K2H47_09545 [Muribaculaceae bacterium]|nr:hypothetical protein [Muribaculaceae bacterium]
MNYPVSASSPTEDLLTLGQIFSEVGDYASTVLDREHLSLSKKCVTRLRKVVGELISRHRIQSAENLYDMPEGELVRKDLTALTVGELHSLYRRWPLRHQARAKAGREHLTYYYEGRIVRELQQRKAANKSEQLKIDYCVMTYRNELDNLSFLLSKPLEVSRNRIWPDLTRSYTPSELVALINLYSHYRDIAERELLIEYTDIAIDLLETAGDKSQLMELASVILELGRRKIITIPTWIGDFLAEAIAQSRHNPRIAKTQLVLPLLTLHLHTGKSTLEQEAIRIINRCYREAVKSAAQINTLGSQTDSATPELHTDFSNTIDALYIAVTYCTYVRDYDVCKIASCWNNLCSCLFSDPNTQITPNSQIPQIILNTPINPTARTAPTIPINQINQINQTTSEIIRLLTVVKEIEKFIEISPVSKASLQALLEQRVTEDTLSANIEACALWR